jgi:hypothetical protein
LISLIFLVLGLVVGAVHVYLDKQPRTKGRVAETFLVWFFVVSVGLLSVVFSISHTVFADATAASIDWPAGNPFQSEVAVANLTVGTLGILCYWIRGNFWIATVIAFSVQWLGAAVVHIRSIVVEANYAPNNAGLTFYLDILMPLVLIALLVYYLYAKRHEQGGEPYGAAYETTGSVAGKYKSVFCTVHPCKPANLSVSSPRRWRIHTGYTSDGVPS